MKQNERIENKIDVEELRRAVKGARDWKDLCDKGFLVPSRTNPSNFKRLCDRVGIDYSHVNFERKFPVPPKEELLELINAGNGKANLAKKYNVSIPVVNRWLEEYNIELRPYYGKSKIRPPKEDLIKLHHIEQKTFEEIMNHYKIAPDTLKTWLNEYGIERKYYRRKRRVFPSKEDLINLNHTEKKTLKDISIMYDVSDVLVGLWFKEHAIELQLNVSGVSKAEDELRDSLNSYGFNFIKQRFNSVGEIDLYDDNYKIGIEYCGLYWHSEEILNSRKPLMDVRKYHYNKFIESKKIGINLFTVFENEWNSKKDVVISILLSKLGKFERIVYARKCVFKEVDKEEAKVFLEENHLQGKSNFKQSYGLFFNDELLMLITFGIHHRNKDKVVLNRLCSKKGNLIVGGAQKLFQHSINLIETDEIITWSDNRWSNGEIYEKLGFLLEEELGPDYFYNKGRNVYSKQSMKKPKDCPPNMTEHNYWKSKGFRIVWDCGKKRWIYRKN